MRGSIDFHGGDEHGEASEADAGDGGRGYCAQGGRPLQRRHHLRSGIHESTFYRWIGDPKNKLQRALSEGLKKEESAFKRTLLTTIRSAALARNQYWTAAAWLLERKYPDEFGKAERKSDEGRVDAAPRIVLGVVAQPVQEKLPGFDEGSANG